MSLPIVLLPGLDGTGDLFEPLTSNAPSRFCPIVIRLPRLGAYRDLMDAIRGQLPAPAEAWAEISAFLLGAG